MAIVIILICLFATTFLLNRGAAKLRSKQSQMKSDEEQMMFLKDYCSKK